MSRRTRTVIVFGVAIGMATIASAGVYRAIQRIPVREVEVAHQYVVVAARPLPMGSQVSRENLRLVAWPRNSPVAGSFTSADPIAGRGLIDSVVENEPITEAKLAPREAGAGLPPAIPQGMRAISVKVNEVVGVAGFVIPGTFVDVLVTVRTQGQRDALSRVVVSNAQVLTAGTRYEQENANKGKPIPSTVVTLMVTPQDAERIALAAAEGSVMLALRNPLDREPTLTSGTKLSHLIGQAEQREVATSVRPQPPVVKAAQPARAPETSASAYKVEAIRAAKRTEETVR